MPLWSRIISDCTSLDTGVIQCILPLTPITNRVRFCFSLHATGLEQGLHMSLIVCAMEVTKGLFGRYKVDSFSQMIPLFLWDSGSVHFHLLEFPLTSPPASLNYPFNSPSSRLHPANHSRWSSGTTANLFEARLVVWSVPSLSALPLGTAIAFTFSLN